MFGKRGYVEVPHINRYRAVNLVIDHLEYLLRRHDCVTVPGIGALMVRYRPARFDSRNPLVLLPPSRELAFNGALTESDGILENSVARRSGVSFEAASRMVKEEVESLLQQLKAFGSIALGRLGELNFSDYGTILFSPFDAAGWDFRNYGLPPLYLKNADDIVRTSSERRVVSAVVPERGIESNSNILSAPEPWEDGDRIEQTEGRRGRFAKSVVGIAASLAVIVTVALFLLNPVKVENEPLKASIAPTEAVSFDEETDDRQSGEYILNEPEPEAESSASLPENGAEVSVSEAVSSNKGESAAAGEVLTAASSSKREMRFSESDPYCVIVASFPEESQASRYIAENPGRALGVLQQDGKYRVYAATGATYEEASAQKAVAGSAGAWICRR